jgi:hypothetical protein
MVEEVELDVVEDVHRRQLLFAMRTLVRSARVMLSGGWAIVKL